MGRPAYRILGIDPGSRLTGYGVIEIANRKVHYVASGCINAKDGELPQRLGTIYRGVSQIITELNQQSLLWSRYLWQRMRLPR